jgi:hypothetical protein
MARLALLLSPAEAAPNSAPPSNDGNAKVIVLLSSGQAVIHFVPCTDFMKKLTRRLKEHVEVGEVVNAESLESLFNFERMRENACCRQYLHRDRQQ